jgi:hypothetical protein
MEGGRGLQLVMGRINATIQRAIQRPDLAAHANALDKALGQLCAATEAAWATGDPGEALANAVPYMQAFGHVVLAWIWLDVLLAVIAEAQDMVARGRAVAARYFFNYELPRIGAWLQVVVNRDRTCADTPEEAF